jgi:hypothetical protein
LLIDLVLAPACGLLFVLGESVLGVIVACVILIISAVGWPVIRYRHARLPRPLPFMKL